MPRIHSTATVDAGAVLADDVEVGPYCLIEADVTIGPGCRLRNHVTIRRHTTLGRDNVLDAGCVLGGEPQDLKFDPACVSFLRVGDHNVLREGVTISRASKPGGATVVGSNTYWMVGSHAGHDTTIGDNVILVNGSAVGGHAVISPRVFLSAHVVVHQFCWVGDMVMTEGNAAMRSHVPPYVMVVGRNCVMGLNVVGLRRAADLTDEDRRQIKEAY
jgi:UDP-N-acetylglucosamine acyltransferase